MSPVVLRKLLREWAALVAILAMALGPLALAASRSLGASEKVAIAAGAKPFALCLPGGLAPGGGPAADGMDCDHCLPVQPFAPADAAAGIPAVTSAACAADRRSTQHAAAFPRAPPARGPPSA